MPSSDDFERARLVVYGFARRQGFSLADAEDIAHRTLVGVLRRYADRQGDEVARIAVGFARRVILKLRTEEFRHHPLGQRAFEIARAQQVEMARYRQDPELEFLLRAIEKLPAQDADLLHLWCSGMSHKEIGVCLGISEGAARTRFNRLKKRLKDYLGEDGE